MRNIKIRSFRNIDTENNQKGFTLIEVMIAVTIFGFLMLYVSQMMRGEIRMLNTTTHQNTVEQNARAAMMHILDEIRLNRAKYYDESTGIYYRSPDTGAVTCLLYLGSDTNNLPAGTGIYYDQNKDELWYRDTTQNSNPKYRIAEFIKLVKISRAPQAPSDEHLILIKITAGDRDSTSNDFSLVTMARLY
ncbi:PilW family protein [Desulfitobacterium sp. Sab5]|uniref:PilW family protein n=1 Tax=Desulfitobacterium nosdiversum TaxID=3375356 RepID=UPI003CEDEF6D